MSFWRVTCQAWCFHCNLADLNASILIHNSVSAFFLFRGVFWQTFSATVIRHIQITSLILRLRHRHDMPNAHTLIALDEAYFHARLRRTCRQPFHNLYMREKNERLMNNVATQSLHECYKQNAGCLIIDKSVYKVISRI